MTRLIGYKQKRGLAFDGTSDLLSVTPSGTGAANLNPNGDEAFSISAWLFNTQTTSVQNQMIYGRHLTTGSWAGLYFRFENSKNQLDFGFSTDNSGTADGVQCRSGYYARNSTINRWVFVTATYDGSETGGGMKVYMNGEDVTATQWTQGTQR